MNFPTTNFSRNLRFTESGLNFSLNLFLSNAKITTIFNPDDYDNSVNIPLLKKYDECEETRGKISFLPINFLENYLLKNKYIDLDNIKLLNLSKYDLKKYYVDLCKKLNIFNNSFFNNETYKSIPVKFFRKLYLASDLSTAIDFCKLNTELEINKDVNDILKINTINPDDIINRNENEWLSKQDLMYIIQSKLYCLSNEKYDNIHFIPLLYIKSSILSESYIYSEILHSYDWNSVPKNKRFIIIIILYRSHFTSVIIDQNVKLNNYKEYKKFAYFFNSCGYNPALFSYNHNYWFIDGSMKILNHKCLNKNNKTENILLPIQTLTLLLYNTFKINNFVFNTFSIQNFDSECGIFSSMFLYFFLNIYQYKNEINILELKYTYFNSIMLGNDLIYGMLRGLFYFTKEDIEYHKISETNYNNSSDIFIIKNKKYAQYKKLYNKNINYILNITNKIGMHSKC